MASAKQIPKNNMAASKIVVSWTVLLSILSLLLQKAAGIEKCPVQNCGSSGVRIKFPFQIISNQGIPSSRNQYQLPRCGYPRFEVSCFLNQTVVMLPQSGPFTVLNIDYNSQSLYINDPENCLPRRYLNNFSLQNSPFYPDMFTNFTFLNCSSNYTSEMTATSDVLFRTVPCLSSENHTVLAVATRYFDESDLPSSSCEIIETVMVPVSWMHWDGLQDNIRLIWTDPYCKPCEDRGDACGFTGPAGFTTGCADPSSSGLSKGTKYAIIIGIGVPGTLSVIGLGCYLCSKAVGQDPQRGRRRPITEFATSITLPPPPAVMVAGLDRPTIESYPETKLGDSGRLPKPSDSTCAICLCEYEAKQTLRTIPECRHYFHAECIDKWLRLSASCPVCRNSPEGSSFVTPSTSTSSRSSSVLSP